MVGRERTFNYPKHPLFGIAPILYNWRGDPRHDEYTSRLVGRIRAGRYMPELWDCNSLYLDYPERAPIAADGPRLAVKSRYTMTAEQRRAWNNSYGDPALNAKRAKRAAAEAERREEMSRLKREWAERRAEKERLEADRAAEWEQEQAERVAATQQRMENALGEIAGFALVSPDSKHRVEERAKILAAPWQCKKCLGRAEIALHLGRYRVVCQPCAFNSVGDHETLIKLVDEQAA